MSREAAREKISHFFRHLRAKTVAEKEESVSAGTAESNEQQSSSSMKRVNPYESSLSSPAHSISTYGESNSNSNNNDQEETVSSTEEGRSKKQFREFDA